MQVGLVIKHFVWALCNPGYYGNQQPVNQQSVNHVSINAPVTDVTS